MNVYRGKSGQLWFEVSREGELIHLKPETYSKGCPRLVTMSIADFRRCGFVFVGVSNDGETLAELLPSVGFMSAPIKAKAVHSVDFLIPKAAYNPCYRYIYYGY